jgi:hypothetical protein
MKSPQFAQLWLPFGALRYPTEAFDIFAAAARFDRQDDWRGHDATSRPLQD